MDPISIGMGLLKFAPKIAGWFGGEDSSDKVQKVTEIAYAITGKNDTSEAIKALEADPNLALKFEESANEYKVAVMQEETKRIEAVNRTMQAEAKSDHWMQWSWRPANGYMFGFTLFGNYFLLPLFSKESISLPEPVLMCWAAVLGVSAFTRGMEKTNKAKTGATEGPLGGILNTIKRHK